MRSFSSTVLLQCTNTAANEETIMDWLLQNWLWILLALGAILLFRRGRHHGLRGLGHGHHGRSGGAHDHSDHSVHPTNPETATDPVTHKDVSTEHAVTSVHQGRIYYFETPESRQQFETSPEKYAREELGHAPSSAESAVERPRTRRRHGC